MNCKNCGELLRENAKFCPKCGQKAEEQEKQVKGKMNKKSFWVVIAATIIAIAGIIGGIVLNVNMKAKNQDTGLDSVKDIEVEELTPMYNITEIETVDIYAQNHTPGTKQEGLKWDSTFFYWLEDIKQDSTEDGYLAKCYITKTMLKDIQTGSEIQYEIYHDPETGEIYKIVSIEKAGETLKLTDYYYQNGKVNFIFTRTDSIYTPTYATIDKVGERFYFDGDVLVKWRKIEEPKVINECTLTRSDVSYVQTSYFEEVDEVRAEYDAVEMKMLNAAYNTYDAVQKSAIGAVNGTVADTLGEPIENLVVDIFRKADEVLLYRGTTDTEGRFNIFTYLDDTECYIVIRGNEEYKESVVYGIVLASSGVDNSYNNLVLHKVNGDFYPVHVSVYFAEEVRTNEDGSVEKNLLSGATVSIREGAGAYEGEVLAVEKADAEGNVHINLQPGTYTAQIEIEGYQTSYLTIEVPEREIEVESYVLRKIPENQTGIVLTWEDEETDLDLTLFTPYQSTEGDMAHIGGNTKSDDYGNQLIADNHAGCEVVYVNTAEQGSYKVYVNNYTDSQAGNYESDTLSKLNVHIYIYDSNGLVAEYTFPAGQNGVVWEAVELNGGKVTPIHRVYDRVDGKKWWNESKEKKQLVKEIEYTSYGDVLGEIEYTYDDYGNMLTYSYKDSILYWEYVYDNEGNIVKKKRYSNADNSYVYYDEYTYDNDGNVLVDKQWMDSEVYLGCTAYNYDEQGNLLHQTEYDSEGRVKKEDIYSFDDKGNVLTKETNTFNTEFEVPLRSWITQYSYDDQGNLIEEIGSGYEEYRCEYSYDKSGKLIKKVYSDLLFPYNSYNCEYSYDQDGYLVKELIMYDDEFSYRSVWTEYIYE